MLFVKRKLITKEDPYYIHKLLGVFCLLNYVYCYTLLLTTGSMNLINNIWTVIPHALLSCTGLIFHISGVRNATAPMIYPEFRVHSIIFAMRSVLCCILAAYNMDVSFKMLVCFLTMMAADATTSYFDKLDQHGRTTSNMPYDKNVSDDTKALIKYTHAESQISATLLMLGTTDSAFSPMFAIQMSALLMSLVRKNLISQRSWHLGYLFTLWINIMLFMDLPLDFLFTLVALKFLYVHIVFPLRINKCMAWSAVFILFLLKQDLYPMMISGILAPIDDVYLRMVIISLTTMNWIRKASLFFCY